MASKVTRDHHNLRRNLRLNDKFLSNDGDDEGIRITNDGNVGIGTSSPSEKLEVNGNIKFTGNGNQLRASDGNNIISDNSDLITIGNAGTSNFYFNNGNVGIGTTSPGAKLHISGDGNLNGLIQSSSTVSYVQFQDSDTGLSSNTNNGTTIGTNTGAFLINNREDKNIQFATNDTTRVTIKNDGNVGIGTGSPEAHLHVQESDDDKYVQRWTLNNMEMGLFGDATNHTMWLQVNSNDHFAIKTNATERMRILQGGNVGIGTTSPSYMLDVAGDISLSGNLRLGSAQHIRWSGQEGMSGNTSTQTITICNHGNWNTCNINSDLTVTGDLTVSGNDISFGSGGVVSDGNGTILIKDSDGDSVFLGIQSSGASASNADAGIRFMESTNHKWNIGWDGSLDEFVMTDHSSGSLSSSKKFIFEKEGYLSIINEENDANGGRLKFVKNKGAAGADNDEIGVILFNGDNDAQELTDFAKIVASISDASDGAEEGKLSFQVASHDAELQPGLQIASGDTEDEVDVTIGNGVQSLTTLAGDLKVTGNSIQSSSGDVAITLNSNDVLLTDSLVLNGDDNNIFFGTDNDVKITHVHNVGLKIDDDGAGGTSFLGIGKTPSQALDVNGKISTNDDIIISTSGKVLKNTGEILALQSTRYVRFGAIGGSTLFEVDNTNSRCDINVNTVITGNLTVTGEVNFDTDGLTAVAGSGSNVDVSIGKGTSSITTIAGNIAFNGTDITSAGSITIAPQAADITLDSPRSIALDTASSSGGLRALHNGTEYSVGQSAYAGMILGYRMIGEDAGHSTEILTTSFAVVDSAMNVKFKAPPSGNVEVMVQIFANSISSNRTIYFGLSDNATYNSIGASYEQAHRLPDETDDSLVQHYWTITGLTTGSIYNYWFGARASATNSYLNWGGTSSLRYPDFIMKVTALPLATTDYAEYD